MSPEVRVRHSTATLLPVALFLVGCGGDSTSEVDAIPALVAEETLRIGSVDDPETSLTSFHALRIGPDGRIYTIHFQESAVRIHAPDGTPLGSFGGRGEGPGEFQSPVSMGFLGDELWVADTRSRRISWFDPDGEFLRDESVQPQAPADERHLPPNAAGLLADGTLHGSAPVISSLIASGEVTESPIVRMARDGTVLDTIAVRLLAGSQLAIMSDGGATFTSQPFSDATIVTLASAAMEVVIVDRAVRPGDPTFHVTKLTIGGDTLWTRSVPFTAVPLEPSVVDSFVNEFGGSVAERGLMTRREVEAELDAELYVPEHLTPVSSAHVGDDGSVWLQRNDRDPAATTWLVLGSDGEILGEVRLPDRFRVLRGRVGEVWGRDLDDLDVPYIVKYAVRAAAPLDATGS